MTPRTPQVGDAITTAEELDSLPAQAVFLADGHVWTWLGAEVRNPMRSPTGGAWTYPGDALRAYGTFTVLYLPGHPPRPEREVKAEALREAADDMDSGWIDDDDLRTAGCEPGVTWHEDCVAQALESELLWAPYLRARADEIARGDH